MQCSLSSLIKKKTTYGTNNMSNIWFCINHCIHQTKLFQNIGESKVTFPISDECVYVFVYGEWLKNIKWVQGCREQCKKKSEAK